MNLTKSFTSLFVKLNIRKVFKPYTLIKVFDDNNIDKVRNFHTYTMSLNFNFKEVPAPSSTHTYSSNRY